MEISANIKDIEKIPVNKHTLIEIVGKLVEEVKRLGELIK